MAPWRRLILVLIDTGAAQTERVQAADGIRLPRIRPHGANLGVCSSRDVRNSRDHGNTWGPCRVTALRLRFERICPPRRDRPVAVELPKIERAADMVTATAALVEPAACGVITPAEAAELGKLIDVHARAIETIELETRIAKLEGTSDGNNQ
jgi:hypothetical protein